jgi:hypothetical protein
MRFLQPWLQVWLFFSSIKFRREENSIETAGTIFLEIRNTANYQNRVIVQSKHVSQYEYYNILSIWTGRKIFTRCTLYNVHTTKYCKLYSYLRALKITNK